MALGLTYAFDANDETPESAARRRALAEAIMGRYASPRNVGEGFGAIASGIVSNVQNRRANRGEAAGRSSANNAFSRLVSGITGGGNFPEAPAVPNGDMAGSGDMTSYQDAIAGIESGSRYDAVGPTHPKLGRALGKYQVMEANVGPWTEKHLGKRMSPDEFLASPEAQDAVFDGEFGSYVNQYGPEGAAQAWFAGPGGVGKMDRKDSLGTSVSAYTDKFRNALGGVPAPIAAAPLAAPDTMQQGQPVASSPAGNRILQTLMSQQPIGGQPQGIEPSLRPFNANERRPNLDGSYSTEISTTQQQPDGQFVNTPSLWMGQQGPVQFNPNDEQGIMSEAQRYEAQNGPTFQRFPSAQSAEQAAIARSAAGGAGQMAQAAPQQPIPPMAGGPAPEMQQEGPGLEELLMTAQNPWLTDSQRGVINMMIQQEMQKNDPKRQLEMENMRGQIDDRRIDNRREDARFGFDQSKFAAESGLNERKFGLDERKFNMEQFPEFYDAYVKQELAAGREPLGVLEYATALKKSGATNITNTVGEGSSEYNKALDKNFADQYIAMQDGAQQARSKLSILQGLGAALGQTTYTGMGAESLLAMKQAGRALGLEMGDDLGPEETARALGNQLALQLRSPSGGAGMPGAMSDKDREFLVASVPSISKTPQGNARLIDFMTRIEQRNIEVAKLAQDYSARNGQIDNGFFQELAKFSEANPLFPDSDMAGQGALPDGVEQEIWDAMTPEEKALWQN